MADSTPGKIKRDALKVFLSGVVVVGLLPKCGDVKSCCVCCLPAGHTGDHFCIECCAEWFEGTWTRGWVRGPYNEGLSQGARDLIDRIMDDE